MQNKKIKTIKAYLALIILSALVVANLAWAATSATVTATVTLQNISVTVASGSVSYGTLASGGVMTTLSGGVSGQQTATNAGNVAEDFNIMGMNSTGGTPNWTLGSAAGSDIYEHRFCKTGCGTNASPTLGTGGTGFTPLTTSYQALASNVSTSGTQTFDLYIKTPTSSTNFTQQTVDVTVQAVAH